MPKLIRDLIPEDMRRHGYEPELRIVEGAEKREWLLKKLVEEAEEALESNGSIEELADVFEVLRSLVNYKESCWLELKQKACAKRKLRGSFTKGYLWLNDHDNSQAASDAREQYRAESAEAGI